jgi:hypothetical protein
LDILTFYESRWLAEGKAIKFVSFGLTVGESLETSG